MMQLMMLWKMKEMKKKRKYLEFFFIKLFFEICSINQLLSCIFLSDAIVSQVLDELGLQLNDQLSGLPQASGSLSIAGLKQPVAAAAGANEDTGNLADADADLQARLENLRRE